MATVPLSATNIRLLSDVPFTNDYKHSRWFDTKTQQTNYFLNKPVVHSITNATFQRIEGKPYIRVDKSIDELWGTNYLMFQNSQYNNKWFYAFVTKLEFIQPKTTYVHFQIDVLQTWRFEMKFKPSFIAREHCKLWNSDGTPVINTVDEGLDYGTDYDVVSVENWKPYGDLFFLVVVSKNAMHTGSNPDDVLADKIVPSLSGLPQPLSYYIHPIYLHDGSSPQVNVGTTNIGISTPKRFLQNIFSHDDAVNNIVSMYITEYIGHGVMYDRNNKVLTLDPNHFDKASISDDKNPNITTVYVKGISQYSDYRGMLGDKYEGYTIPKESKLLMYPYTVLILDDFKGNRMVLKNEFINSKELNIRAKGSLGTSNKVAYYVEDYLIDGDVDDRVIPLENSLINNNPNDLPIITDMLSAFLQGNRNSLENQKNMIDWNAGLNAIGNAIGGIASAGGLNPIGLASSGTNVVQGLGSAQLQIQGIEAKKKDISNLPPQLTKMGSNTNFDYGNGVSGVFVIKKEIKPEYRKKLEDYFNMYGYKVNEVKVPNFHTRRYWNYIQTISCNILGNFNNEDLQELKSIFDNGITLWHTDDVGNYSLNNEVI